MSSSPLSSLIHKLDCDVLLYIFELNANMFSDRTALRTTRAASQVCQHWRAWMLDTPSLWAKLIDLDKISHRDYDWMNEVLRRSGTAPLWIRVEHIESNKPANPAEPILQFFFDIADANWRRIQKLVVNFHENPMFHATRWESLYLPAPELETCAFIYEWTSDMRVERPDEDLISTLFAGYAPKLRQFSFSSYIIPKCAPWLGNLHTMHLDNAYDVPLAIAILSSMYRLQELKIHRLNDENTSTPLPTASLPHLKYFEYTGQAHLCAALLEHITIPSDCSMYIPVSPLYMPENTTEAQFMSVVDSFTRYVSRYLQSCPPKVICLEYERSHYMFLKAGAALPHDLPLGILFPVCHRGGSNPIAATMNKLAMQDLSSVMELRFYASGPLDTSFSAFFSCLTSLETLWTDRKTLERLAALQNDTKAKATATATTQPHPLLFPSLKRINLTDPFPGRYMHYDSFTVDAEVRHTCCQVTDKVEF